MNKLLTVCASLAIITCGSVSAQKKGEVSIGGIIGISGGYSGIRSEGNGTPSSTAFNAGAEFGWFFADNWRLGASVQYALESNPYDESSDGWLRQNTNLVLVGPDLTYYLKIRDGFYFTPGVAMFGTVGSVKVETRDIYVSKNVVGYGVELAPGAFEFRPTPHFAFSVSFLTLGYSFTNIKKVGQNDYDVKTDVLTYNLAIQPSIGLRYYF